MLYISLIAIAENESTKSNRLELFETYTVKITNKITPYSSYCLKRACRLPIISLLNINLIVNIFLTLYKLKKC